METSGNTFEMILWNFSGTIPWNPFTWSENSLKSGGIIFLREMYSKVKNNPLKIKRITINLCISLNLR